MSHRTTSRVTGLLATVTTVGLLLAGSGAATAGPAPAAPAGEPQARLAAAQETNKQVALDFVEQVFNEGDLDALDEFVQPDVVSHNPQIGTGIDEMRDYLTETLETYPDLKVEVVRSLAEGDLVMVHSNRVSEPDTLGLAVADIFRFTDGLIAEHWDVSQEVPETTTSGNDMFGTLSEPPMNEPDPDVPADAARRVATVMYGEMTLSRDLTSLDRHLGDPFYQHTPTVDNGIVALKQALAPVFLNPTYLIATDLVVAEHDYVAFYTRYGYNTEDGGDVTVDIYRVRDDKVVEHWDVSQPAPAPEPVDVEVES